MIGIVFLISAFTGFLAGLQMGSMLCSWTRVAPKKARDAWGLSSIAATIILMYLLPVDPSVAIPGLALVVGFGTGLGSS